MNNKIALIICYYGTMPWYFNYFLHTGKYNPDVDFYIVTDNIINDIPQNFKLIIKPLWDLKLLIEDKLGFKTQILQPYKLCDFKPCYGHIFSEILTEYDFWGYCDIDVIFGNIRAFMTDEILSNFDLFSVRPDWIPGCFSLFKNTKKINLLYTNSKDYKLVLESSNHFCFDETNFRHRDFEDGKHYFEIPSQIESMMHVIRKLEANGVIKPYFDLHIIEGGCPGNLKWNKGSLVYKNKAEILLYHLIQFKRNYAPPIKKVKIKEVFSIGCSKIW